MLDAEAELALQRGDAPARARGRRAALALTGGQANPAWVPAHDLLARALAASDRPEEARAAAATSLERAEAWGAPATLGRALRLTGELNDDVEALQRAVAVLEPSRARLERAKTLAELGRRLSGDAAAEALAAARDLAEVCGARRLAAACAEVLAATGGPARAAAGVSALTSLERRVADLADAGQRRARDRRAAAPHPGRGRGVPRRGAQQARRLSPAPLRATLRSPCTGQKSSLQRPFATFLGMQTRIRHLLIATTGALALLPATAFAGTIDIDGDKLVVKSGSGENTLTLRRTSREALDRRQLRGLLLPRGPLFAAEPRVPGHLRDAGRGRGAPGEGDDSLVVFPGLDQSVRVHGLGEQGKDELRAIDAPGDITYDGGAGDDVLDLRERRRHAAGGAGTTPYRQQWRGRAARRRGRRPAPRRRGRRRGRRPRRRRRRRHGRRLGHCLRRAARERHARRPGQRRRPGEGDDVRDIERFDTFVAGTFVMSDGPDRVSNFPAPTRAARRSTAAAATTSSPAGARSTPSTAARQRPRRGRRGHDTLTGGPGQDQIFGDSTSGNCGGYGQSCTVPFGNDVIDARDGEADQVDCGIGEDKAVVDAIDTVAACETVETAGARQPWSGPAAVGRRRRRRPAHPGRPVRRREAQPGGEGEPGQGAALRPAHPARRPAHRRP